MFTYEKRQVSLWTGLTSTQLDYFVKLGVCAPDVGGKKKKYSSVEARITVIASAALRLGISASDLAAPISKLRAMVGKNSDDQCIASSFMEATMDRQDCFVFLFLDNEMKLDVSVSSSDYDFDADVYALINVRECFRRRNAALESMRC